MRCIVLPFLIIGPYDKRMLHSVLDEIPNVGKRRKELLKHFGSVENIKRLL